MCIYTYTCIYTNILNVTIKDHTKRRDVIDSTNVATETHEFSTQLPTLAGFFLSKQLWNIVSDTWLEVLFVILLTPGWSRKSVHVPFWLRDAQVRCGFELEFFFCLNKKKIEFKT